MTEYSLISHFALTISPGNRTRHEGFILIICHARLHKTGTGRGKAAAAISCLGGSSSSHPHIPALRPSQRELDRDRGRDNVGYSFTISKKNRKYISFSAHIVFGMGGTSPC